MHVVCGLILKCQFNVEPFRVARQLGLAWNGRATTNVLIQFNNFVFSNFSTPHMRDKRHSFSITAGTSRMIHLSGECFGFLVEHKSDLVLNN